MTKEHLVEYGVHPRLVAPSLRALEALGLIICTERGRGGACAEFRKPSLFRLTYLPGEGNKTKPTDEWEQIDSLEIAHEMAKKARATKSAVHVKRSRTAYQRRKKTENQVHKVALISGAQSGPKKWTHLGAQSGPMGLGVQSGPTSISLYISGHCSDRTTQVCLVIRPTRDGAMEQYTGVVLRFLPRADMLEAA